MDTERRRVYATVERRDRGCGGSWVFCIITIISCWLIHCTLGISYSFGNINPYLTSYLRNASGDSNLGYTDTMWISSANGVSACILMLPVGILSAYLPTPVYILLGALTTAAMMFGTYQTIQTSFPLTVVTYGLVGGVPTAILYPAAINIAAKWFPSNVGLVSGLVLTGYGCGAVAWNQLTTWYINPDNLQPDVTVGGDVYYSQPEVLSRVPGCFLLLGFVITGIQFLAAILVRSPPPPSTQTKTVVCNPDETARLISSGTETHVPPYSAVNVSSHDYDAFCGDAAPNQYHAVSYREEETLDDTEFRGHADDIGPEYQPKDLLKSRVFWTLWGIVFFSDLACSFIITLFKAYGQTFINDDHFLTLVASFSSIFNAAGRPFWGSLTDKLGPRMIALYTQCLLACLVATFVTCEVTGRVTYAVWLCLMFFTMCGYFTSVPILTIGLFGPKYLNANMGLLFTAGAVCSLIAALVARDLKNVFGWHGVFFFCFGCIFTGILLNLTLDLRCGRSIPNHMCKVLSIRT